MEPVIARSGRTPFEVWLLIACVLSGVGGLANPYANRSIGHVLPAWELYGWYGGLALTGGVSLFGAFRRTEAGLTLERGGLIVLAVLAFVYAASLVAAGGWPLAVAAALTVSFSAACIWRAGEIARDLKRAHEISEGLS